MEHLLMSENTTNDMLAYLDYEYLFFKIQKWFRLSKVNYASPEIIEFYYTLPVS